MWLSFSHWQLIVLSPVSWNSISCIMKWLIWIMKCAIMLSVQGRPVFLLASILIYLHLIIWLYFMQLWIDCNKISDHMPLDYTYTEQCKTTFLSLKLQCLGFLLIPLISMFKYRYHSKRCFKKEKVHRQKQTRQWIRRWVVWSLVLWLCCIPSHRYTYT